MAGFTKIAKSDDIQPGQARMFEVGGKRIALFNVDGLFFAIDDTRTHRGGPLSEGSLMVKKSPIPCTAGVFNAAAPENVRAREGLNAPRGWRRREGG